LDEIFPGPLLESSGHAEVTTLSSIVLINERGRLTPAELPIQAQFAPVYALEFTDVNLDGIPDLLLAGNQSATRVRLGPIDANFGQLYLGDGKGNFRYVSQLNSGFKVRGDVRSVSTIHYQGKKMLVFGVNNSPAEFYIPEIPAPE
jgi:hypothetical protein